jgi:hypothetical protein
MESMTETKKFNDLARVENFSERILQIQVENLIIKAEWDDEKTYVENLPNNYLAEKLEWDDKITHLMNKIRKIKLKQQERCCATSKLRNEKDALVKDLMQSIILL